MSRTDSINFGSLNSCKVEKMIAKPLSSKGSGLDSKRVDKAEMAFINTFSFFVEFSANFISTSYPLCLVANTFSAKPFSHSDFTVLQLFVISVMESSSLMSAFSKS